MQLDDLLTISDIAAELGASHNAAWRFARRSLGDGLRVGNQRLYAREQAVPAIKAQRRRMASK